jgi:hypothetical protein
LTSLFGSVAAAGRARDANMSKTATEDVFIAPTPWKSSFLVCRPRPARGGREAGLRETL